MFLSIMKKMKSLSLALVFTASTISAVFAAPGQSFEEWTQSVKKRALKEGISTQTTNSVLDDLTVLPRVLQLDRKQPEGTISFAQYRQRVITQSRIDQGRALMQQHASALEAVSQRYGVDPQYIVALWGMETSYGANTGGFDVINSLATLAYDGRRKDFFTDELVAALHILDQGHITRDRMKGSWAGAMGQNQFMPSSFRRLAVDGDNDGKKDIWTNLNDVFASSANYLSRSGWKAGERWGREVRIPKGFPKDLLTMKNFDQLKVVKSLAEWEQLGLTQTDGSPLPVVGGMQASLVTPDGIGGPAYLVYDNYRTIMKWNRSTYFATSVGLLANAIAQ